MTLAELLPSLRASLPRRLAPGAWPRSARHLPGGDLSVGGAALRELVSRTGAPVAVVDLAAYAHDVLGAGRFVTATSAAELATAAALGTTDHRVVRPCDLPGPSHGTVLVADQASLRALERRSSVTDPAEVVLVVATRSGIARRRAMSHDGAEAAFDPYGPAFADALRTVSTSPRLTLTGLFCRAEGEADAVLRAVRVGVEVAAGLFTGHGVAIERLYVRRVPASGAPLVGAPCLDPDTTAADARRAVRLQAAVLGAPAPLLLLDLGPDLAAPCEVVVHRVVDVVASAQSVVARLDCDDLDLDLGPAGPAHLLTRLSGASDTAVRLVARRGQGSGNEAGRAGSQAAGHGAGPAAGQAAGQAAGDVLLPLDVRPGDLVAVPVLGRLGLDRCRRAPLVGVRDGEVVALLAGLGAHRDTA